MMRTALQAILWLAIPSLLWAQQAADKQLFELRIVTDRSDALYSVNDPVKFIITLSENGSPLPNGEIDYILSNDGQELSRGKATVIEGQALVTGTLPAPGFLRCQLSFKLAEGGEPITARAAAGIDPLQIKPSMPAPDDFDEFWAEQKRKLAAVPMNPVLTEIESNNPGIAAYDLKIDCLEAMAPVSAYFARPEDAKPKSHPAMLRVHGAGIYPSSKWEAVEGAKMGMLTVDLNAHGVANEKPREYYAELGQTLLKGYSHRGREDRESCYFLAMYLRMVRAMDFLTAQPEWDGKVLIVKGVSQGGAQAIAAAGLDSRVSIFGAGVPALCNQPGPISGWPWLVARPNGMPDRDMLHASRYFDPVNFAARTHAAAVLSVGFIDRVCPPSTVYMAYNNLRGKKLMVNRPLMNHASPQDIKDIFTGIFLEHVDQVKLSD
jgi:cephalosporin-C deacetylase-like acetyl esterase